VNTVAPRIAFLLALANLAIGFFAPGALQLVIGLAVMAGLTLDHRDNRHANPTTHR
jgi:hypothetical protein